MDSVTFLQDFAVVLLVSGLVTLLFHKANQPRVVGYILAGVIIGPHTPPFSFVHDEATIHTLAELGVVFLMFSLGLEFNLRRLRRVGLTALITAVLDVAIMVWLGYQLGRQLGWSPVESLFLGGIVCDSSTTILMRILHELGRERDKAAQIAIGISVVEDVLAIAMMALLTGVGLSGGVHPSHVAGRLWTLAIFLVVVIVAGLLAVPRLLNALARYQNDELLVVTAVGLCFGVALAAVHLQLSLALGAVLVGMLASEAHVQRRLSDLVAPLRSIFSAVFFVSIGLMLDLRVLFTAWLPILLGTLLVVSGKFLTNLTGSLLTGQGLPTSLRVGAGMAQVGEFAFIIAALGVSLNATGSQVYQAGVAIAVLSIIISPYLIRLADRVAGREEEEPSAQRWAGALQLYTQWIGRLSPAHPNQVVRQIVRRSILMATVNMLLIAAILGAAAWAAGQPAAWMPAVVRRSEWYPALMLMAAVLLAMPLYLVTLRKFNAMGMVLAELSLPITVTAPWARHVRAFVANVVTLAGVVALILLTFILTASMMPSLRTLLLLAGGVVLITFWGRRHILLVYSRAHNALHNVLQQHEPGGPAPAPAALQSAAPAGALDLLQMGTLQVPATGGAAGQTLRALSLRARTGVSVVGIERGGQQMVNPDPDMPLHGGDRLVVLGNAEQVHAAEALLAAPQG